MKHKILCVDDDERTLNIMATHLSASGFRVLTSTSPFIAPLLERERPDLVVLDISMPLLTGDRIASVLSRQEFFARTPIIFFSGEAPERIEHIARQFPSASSVSKQSGLDSLVERIQSILS